MLKVVKRSKKSGLPPGILLPLEERAGPVTITVLDYDGVHYQEATVSTDECLQYKNTPTVTWINVDGVHDIAIVEKIGHSFDIHPLVLEDIVTIGQRPKMEDYSEYVFVVLRMLFSADTVQSEQVSLILGSTYVISFQEKKGDVFDAVRDRIRKGTGKIRKMGPDYLTYALVDAIVDNYFVILEEVGERIENTEEELLTDPGPETMHTIQGLKREMMVLRKAVWPLREMVSMLERGESPVIKQSTALYMRDVYDHTIQVIETIEMFRDMLSGMLDIYLSSISNKMNEIMKVLTIIATIFIPLTFVAGVYGMNFVYMPELHSRWAYPAVLVAMGCVGGLMGLYFKRKKWL